ncbi:hypothetical protein [Streptomyces rubiginosohelvolus]|uniref:hypothetical protein n=1 Tax=Streptomyces rubiginosohelvolus TaxID=67362 RepID=UPI00371985FD
MLPTAQRTFYTRHRLTASLAAAGSAALAATLALVGSSATPRTPAPNTEARAKDAYEAFLADLPSHRPTGERHLESGHSKPGLPVVISTPASTRPDGRAFRVAYRCHAPTSATVHATGRSPQGIPTQFPASPRGAEIATVALGAHQGFTLNSDADDAIILWAVLQSSQ